jgi:hypothetical protein
MDRVVAAVRVAATPSILLMRLPAGAMAGTMVAGVVVLAASGQQLERRTLEQVQVD